jgi:negative regulator of flagellin synthesis FlgM
MTNPISGVAGTAETPEIHPSAGSKSGQASGTAPSASAAVGADSADVAQTQSLLETINAAAAAVPTVNQDRVSAVRTAIAQGTYQINPQQVAKQLIQSEQDLTGLASPTE